MRIIPEQLELRPELPHVIQNKDYHEYKNRLLRIDEILLVSGIEDRFVERHLQKWDPKGEASEKEQKIFQRYCRKALRCNIARNLLEKEYRKFSLRVADSLLLQQFCGMNRIEGIKGSSKSALERYDKWCSSEEIREVIDDLNQKVFLGENKLNLTEDLKLTAYFSDTTCIKANIHFPVDWVLLRDAVRTCIKALLCIREHGLKYRMPEPHYFLKEINRLCIGMTQCRRTENAVSIRKRMLRKMKKVAKIVGEHAVRYLELLERDWEKTDFTEGQMKQISSRLRGVLEKLPFAIKQAHERIIGGRKVSNEDKILSLYEPDIEVIVRGKSGAEVEFGNRLFLAEQYNGVILDWQFDKRKIKSEIELMQESLERQNQIFGRYPSGVGGDRGFWSRANQNWLSEHKIFSGIVSKSPKELEKQMDHLRFRKLQKRRAQTEGRIGILKNAFLGSPLKSKGFEHRSLAVGWAILTHNLWLLAGLPQMEDQKRKKAA